MASNSKKNIIVPWDFTEQSEIALQHAYQLAQVVGDNIMLVAFVAQPGIFSSGTKYEQTLSQCRDKLKEEADKLRRKFDEKIKELSSAIENQGSGRKLLEVNLKTLVKGYKSVRKTFKELYHTYDVNMVVTSQYYKPNEGTSINLLEGLSKLRVGRTNALPFIVVSRPPTHRYYTDIVVPLDYENTYKETLSWVAYLASYYRCNVNMIKPPVKEERKKKQLLNNIYFTKKVLGSKEVVYGLKTAASRENFPHEVFEFVKDIDADMLIIMTDKQKYFFDDPQVKANCPIMLVNPLSKKYQSFY